MSLLLDWWSIEAGDPDYDSLPRELQVVMAQTDEPGNANDAIFDPLLRTALRFSYRGVVNSYLQSQISMLGFDEPVEGEGEAMRACVCCGYLSLEAPRQGWDVCHVCFWEDDGTKGLDAVSAANHLTLREARLSFQHCGAVTPELQRCVLPDGKLRYAASEAVLVSDPPPHVG